MFVLVNNSSSGEHSYHQKSTGRTARHTILIQMCAGGKWWPRVVFVAPRPIPAARDKTGGSKEDSSIVDTRHRDWQSKGHTEERDCEYGPGCRHISMEGRA